MSKKLSVLVTGATGKQGGHVARLLLRHGYRVLAFTRSPDSPAAQSLKEAGAKLVAGDLTDPTSLQRAIPGVDIIYGVTTFLENGVDAEVLQGKNLVDIAHNAGIRLIFSSVASANKQTGIPHFDSKWKIEQAILQSRMEYTIVAPVYFMENLITYGMESLKNGIYASPLSLDRKLAQVCLDDIAKFVLMVIENPKKFLRKRIDIASDSLTGHELTELLAKILNKKIDYAQVPLDKLTPEMITMFKWFQEVGFNIDVELLHREYPEVRWHSFEQWAKQRNLANRILHRIDSHPA